MKKQFWFSVFSLIFFICSFSGYAQNIRQPLSGNQPKTVSEARSISLINTAISVGAGLTSVAAFDDPTVQKVGAYVTVYGILMGPATGNFYAEDYPRGVTGMGARAIGAILMVDATREIFGNRFADALNVDKKEVSLTDTKMLVGEAFMVAGLIYNLISLKNSVDEFNAGKQNISVNVKPKTVNDRVAPVLTTRINF